MSTQQHIPHQVIRSAFGVAEKLEPLKTKKDPIVAAIAAFVLGGVGLGIYLGSVVDFFVPWLIVLILMVLGIPFGELPLFFTPFFWAFWGYRRVKASNAKLDAGGAERIIDAEVITEPLPSRTVQIPATNSRRDMEFRLRNLTNFWTRAFLRLPNATTRRRKF